MSSQEAACIFILQEMDFLQQMVRILTGTLIEVGQGKCAPDKITRILDAQDRQAAGPTAPAQGLFLVNVGYEDK